MSFLKITTGLLAAQFLVLGFLGTAEGSDFSAPPAFYESEPEDEDDEWQEESLDTYGNPIKDFEYRDQWEKQAKKIQSQASQPFGQAGKTFGQKNSEESSGSPKQNPASPEPAIKSETILKETKDSKPRVLIS